MEQVRRDLEAVEAEARKAIVGQDAALRALITAIFADGHVLLEGLPGLGKTIMVKTLREILKLSWSRIQFTPDLMPADITGTNVIAVREDGEKGFRFEPGPIFANLLLADEINRASPKTQSALLQAMQEREVTAFGRHFVLEDPFYVVATQNPIEMEGTYPLPEAQLDRFLFKIVIAPPDLENLQRIALLTSGPEPPRPGVVLTREGLLRSRDLIRRIPVAGPVLEFAARLIQATHPDRPEAPAATRTLVRYGASPRGLQALLAAARVCAARAGRFHISREDVLENLLPALRHRILLGYEGELQRVSVDALLGEIAAAVGARD